MTVGKTDQQWRAYGNLRCIMERIGGRLDWNGEGRNGFWEFVLVLKVLPATGNRNLPELDRFYKPKSGVKEPRVWEDYSDDLIEGAEEQFIAWLGPLAHMADLRQKLQAQQATIEKLVKRLELLEESK
jgi:hypothetical protein